MTQQSVKENKNSTFKKTILITLLVMLALVGAFHILMPLLGITLAITASIWSIAIVTIVMLCVAALLFFILTGVGAFVLGIFVFVWTVLAIILFPLLFPILIPVLLLMFVIGLITRKK